MKKSVKLLGVVFIVALTLIITGCDGNNHYMPDPPSSVSRKPTFEEIVETVETNGANAKEILRAYQEGMSELTENMDLAGIIEYVKAVQNSEKFKISDNMKLTNIAEVGMLSNLPYYQKVGGPILIIKGAEVTRKVGNGTETKKANIVLLCGTMCDGTIIEEGKEPVAQATSLLEDLYSSMGLMNEYVYDTYYAIYENLKGEEDVDLIIGGLSLGGMVAQQVAGLPAIHEYFNVTNVISIAAPTISPDKINYSETRVQRIVDRNDIVPKLSVYSGNTDVNNYAYNEYNNAVVIEGPYNNYVSTHTLSYTDKKLWGHVDALGFVNGNATVSFKQANMTWYASDVE